MVGRDQYGYIKGSYYMVKPGPKPPGEHNKMESKTFHKLGRFPKLRARARRRRRRKSILNGLWAFVALQNSIQRLRYKTPPFPA